MNNTKSIKAIIKDLQEYKYTLEPFSRASINTHNEILKFKKMLPDPVPHDMLDILVTSYVNLGLVEHEICDILDALEETSAKFYYLNDTVSSIYKKVCV